ncbi:armadillo repeat-containing protein 8-like [Watersipora subatra]|uniref:armadillo repeat-containing protein 8-like n=1 Tax=Watersipora subatra TaxID=2589382 RepID=UPI00355B1A91
MKVHLLQSQQGTSHVMDVDANSSPLLEADSVEHLLEQIVALKNRVIGNKREKVCLIKQGIVGKLLAILNDEGQHESVRIESVIVLGSLVKSSDDQIYAVLAAGAIDTLLRGLADSNVKYIELCLCCLRSLSQSSICPKDFIYSDPAIVPHLLSLVDISATTQACVATILSECCENNEQQIYLHSRRSVEILLPALHSNLVKSEHAVLKFYACLCYQNKIVSSQMLSTWHNGSDLRHTVLRHLGRDKPFTTRILAAKCLVFLHRAGALTSTDPGITLRVLPTLVTACKGDKSVQERTEGAELIAYLTELDVDLQRQASITDHCIPVLATFFKVERVNGCPIKPAQRDKLHEACLSAYASLAANDEDIRKRIIETDKTMDQMGRGLNSQSVGLQLAAVRCLHSLSRSVQQLRTSFQDHPVWKPLMMMLRTDSCDELLNVASSTLCNLLLEFSPNKEAIVDLGAVDLLVYLTFSQKVPLRLNAVWGLMNMAFQADQKVKAELIRVLGSDQLFSLLRDPFTEIVMKTLGLLRNLLSPKPHIDDVMQLCGEHVIQAVVMILESEHNAEIKEQTLCILGNVADGNASKDYIMNNDDILKKILDYMQHSNKKLNMAALFCVTNLIWDTEETGCLDRQQKLLNIGVDKIIEQLKRSPDKVLSEKADTTLRMFSAKK